MREAVKTAPPSVVIPKDQRDKDDEDATESTPLSKPAPDEDEGLRKKTEKSNNFIADNPEIIMDVFNRTTILENPKLIVRSCHGVMQANDAVEKELQERDTAMQQMGMACNGIEDKMAAAEANADSAGGEALASQTSAQMKQCAAAREVVTEKDKEVTQAKENLETQEG